MKEDQRRQLEHDLVDCSSDEPSDSETEQLKLEYIELLKMEIEKDKVKEDLKKQKKDRMRNKVSTDTITSVPSLIDRVQNDKTLPFFPEMIEQEHKHEFLKQFGDIIGKKLKQKLEKVQNLKQKQIKFQRSEGAPKQSLVLSLDDCLLKTSIFKQELPRTDGHFKFQKLEVYVCFRNHLAEFLQELKKHFELIIWTSS